MRPKIKVVNRRPSEGVRVLLHSRGGTGCGLLGAVAFVVVRGVIESPLGFRPVVLPIAAVRARTTGAPDDCSVAVSVSTLCDDHGQLTLQSARPDRRSPLKTECRPAHRLGRELGPASTTRRVMLAT
jgi:hypothetical protein